MIESGYATRQCRVPIIFYTVHAQGEFLLGEQQNDAVRAKLLQVDQVQTMTRIVGYSPNRHYYQRRKRLSSVVEPQVSSAGALPENLVLRCAGGEEVNVQTAALAAKYPEAQLFQLLGDYYTGAEADPRVASSAPRCVPLPATPGMLQRLGQTAANLFPTPAAADSLWRDVNFAFDWLGAEGARQATQAIAGDLSPDSAREWYQWATYRRARSRQADNLATEIGGNYPAAVLRSRLDDTQPIFSAKQRQEMHVDMAPTVLELTWATSRMLSGYQPAAYVPGILEGSKLPLDGQVDTVLLFLEHASSEEVLHLPDRTLGPWALRQAEAPLLEAAMRACLARVRPSAGWKTELRLGFPVATPAVLQAQQDLLEATQRRDWWTAQTQRLEQAHPWRKKAGILRLGLRVASLVDGRYLDPYRGLEASEAELPRLAKKLVKATEAADWGRETYSVPGHPWLY